MVKKLVLGVWVMGAALWAQELPQFEGRKVTVTEPKLIDEGFDSEGPASVCIEGPPQRQCYTAPNNYGRSPHVEVVQLDSKTSALFFTVVSGGVSGFVFHFALLRPGDGKELENLLRNADVSNQSQHAFWKEPSISNARIFVTADYKWGPGESHYSDHRYVISVYALIAPPFADFEGYYLEDQYMTVRTYALDNGAEILKAEKSEILARLKKVKAERERKR